MACDNCNGLTGFWCPVCQPPTGIDTRDIHARAPIDRIKALEAEVERLRAKLDSLAESGTGYSQQTVDAIAGERDKLRAENARLTSELDAANNGFRLLGLSPDAATICRQTRQQNCHTCTNFACGDNQVVEIRRRVFRERNNLRANNDILSAELDAAKARIAKVREWATKNRKSKPFSAEDILDILNGKEVERV